MGLTAGGSDKVDGRSGVLLPVDLDPGPRGVAGEGSSTAAGTVKLEVEGALDGRRQNLLPCPAPIFSRDPGTLKFRPDSHVAEEGELN